MHAPMNFFRLLRCLSWAPSSLPTLRKYQWTYMGRVLAAYTSRPQGASDGEIYCAIHNVTDWNPLLNNQQFRARENGEVPVEHRPGEGLDWIEAPPFTTNLRYAEALLPEATPEKYAPRHCRRGPSRMNLRR
jgi:hypothetical protein